MNSTIKHLETTGKKIKLDLFKKFCQVREGHPGSVLSIFDITNTLYEGNYLKIQPKSNLNDTFIMSKGHAASVQYPFLVRKGLINKSDWDNWGKSTSNLRVFGNKGIPGIDVTSGSLGHGVGIACGFAIADRMDHIERNNIVIISEGELYEGSTWEALLFLKHQKLLSIKIILDVNRNMILGRPEDCLGLENICEKFTSFGFENVRFDGHDYSKIINAMDFLFEKSNSPRIIIADTIKGKGVSFMEDKAESHYWAGITDEQMEQMIEELS